MYDDIVPFVRMFSKVDSVEIQLRIVDGCENISVKGETAPNYFYFVRMFPIFLFLESRICCLKTLRHQIDQSLISVLLQ